MFHIGGWVETQVIVAEKVVIDVFMRLTGAGLPRL